MPAQPAWDSRQYLRFEQERTQPSRDLVARIDLERPQTVVDLGCGPGNSTEVLRSRWPEAELTGVDSSPEMLESARAHHPDTRWVKADVRSWTPSAPCDLLFANAALHWIPDHPRLISRLWSFVHAGGALAFQVPARPQPLPPWIEAWNEVRQRPRWADRGLDDVASSPILSVGEYYDLLSPTSTRVDLWETEYHHVLPGPESIVEWVRGASLRGSLTRLGDSDRRALLEEFGRGVADRYPRHASGAVIFPFLRRFVVAYR